MNLEDNNNAAEGAESNDQIIQRQQNIITYPEEELRALRQRLQEIGINQTGSNYEQNANSTQETAQLPPGRIQNNNNDGMHNTRDTHKQFSTSNTLPSRTFKETFTLQYRSYPLSTRTPICSSSSQTQSDISLKNSGEDEIYQF